MDRMCFSKIFANNDKGEGENTFQKLIEWVINYPGSDTDTNAVINGGLIVTIFRFEKLQS